MPTSSRCGWHRTLHLAIDDHDALADVPRCHCGCVIAAWIDVRVITTFDILTTAAGIGICLTLTPHGTSRGINQFDTNDWQWCGDK